MSVPCSAVECHQKEYREKEIKSIGWGGGGNEGEWHQGYEVEERYDVLNSENVQLF